MPAVFVQPPTQKVGATYTSPAAEASKNVASGKGVLNTLLVANSNAAARFVWVFDSLTAAGTPLLAPISVPAGGSVLVPLPFGVPFTTGLTVAQSSTQATFTAGAADLQMTVGYSQSRGFS